MIIFVCDSRDNHAMDWFHAVKEICVDGSVIVATDISNNESNDISLLKNDDTVVQLLNINRLLFKKQSRFADIWRNLIKLIATPLQVFGLLKLSRKYPDSIFHAHSMYYIFLCWLARLKFIATPMGSDVLVRPDESSSYRYFTSKALKAAYLITGDSTKMQKKIKELSDKDSFVIQNGIDVKYISSFISELNIRKGVVSIRGLYPNYRIEKILYSRRMCDSRMAITFIYPFYESNYREELFKKLIPEDVDLGRLTKEQLYSFLSTTLLVISIPLSDSSPRSVYEAIFSGACVAVTYSPWIDTLPSCMSSRLYIVDIDNPFWFDEAIAHAKDVVINKYIPSKEALLEYDQYESMKMVCKEIYKII